MRIRNAAISAPLAIIQSTGKGFGGQWQGRFGAGNGAPCRAMTLVTNSRCSAQVSTKALAESKLMSGVIDVPHRSRYSQGQIPELVANTIPRSFQAAQSNRSVLPAVLRFSSRQQPAPLVSLTPLFASAMFAAQVYLSFPAVAYQAAAGFFLAPQPMPRRL